MRLLIVSNAIHFEHEGRYWAYGAYSREIEVWAELFSEVVIAAPLRREKPPGDCEPFRAANLTLEPQVESGGLSVIAKIKLALATAGMSWRLIRTMAGADAIHVRCPGNLGLLAVIFGPLFTRRLVCKYAGQWSGYPGEAVTYRLTRWLLKSPWWRGPVTVYGQHPNQPPQVVPFFTSVMDDAQMERAGAATARLQPTAGPLRIVYVGRLSEAKNIDVLLEAAGRLAAAAIPFHVTIVGEGPERESLERLATSLEIEARVTFTGGVAGDKVFDYLEQADVSVLVSNSEGWPKALTESMSFGLYCIASDRGLMPEFLGEGRGAIVPTRDAQALADALRHAVQHPAECLESRRKAAAWAQQYSLSGLREALRRLLTERWGGDSGLEPGPGKPRAAQIR